MFHPFLPFIYLSSLRTQCILGSKTLGRPRVQRLRGEHRKVRTRHGWPIMTWKCRHDRRFQRHPSWCKRSHQLESFKNSEFSCNSTQIGQWFFHSSSMVSHDVNNSHPSCCTGEMNVGQSSLPSKHKVQEKQFLEGDVWFLLISELNLLWNVFGSIIWGDWWFVVMGESWHFLHDRPNPKSTLETWVLSCLSCLLCLSHLGLGMSPKTFGVGEIWMWMNHGDLSPLSPL